MRGGKEGESLSRIKEVPETCSGGVRRPWTRENTHNERGGGGGGVSGVWSMADALAC